jgi:tRNA A-37 threonylcarbamoyl transferase component Bud32
VILCRSIDGKTVRKVAHTSGERIRLERELTVLEQARHPGVVHLVDAEVGDDGPSALVLAAVDGGPLADAGQLSPRHVAALGAELATTLADLHDIGVIHGGLDPSHVLLDGDGRPVLCSFGRGRSRGDRDGPSPADDVAALAAMLESQLDGSEAVLLRRALARARARRRGPARRPSSRRLAATLGTLGALGAMAVQPAGRPPNRRGPVVIALVAIAVAAAVAGWAVTTGARSRPSCPPVDAGCRPLAHTAGTVNTPAGRYRVGRPGDQVVLGRWQCAPDARLALLRPATGEVWAFDGWAGLAGTLAARLVTTVPGATGLRVASSGSGCDRLVVLRVSGPSLLVDTGPVVGGAPRSQGTN